MKSGNISAENQTDVVYRRSENAASGNGKPTRHPAPSSERLAPTLRPLIIGFALLLALVVALGVLSVRRLDTALHSATEPRDQLLGRMRRLLQIQGVTARLYNEAQARMRRVDNPKDQTKPLFSLPDRKSTRLNSSHTVISYAVFCLKKKK